MIYTIHYDGLNLENDGCTPEYIDAYYSKHPFQKTCDVIESTHSDMIDGYYDALNRSDHRLSISHVQVFTDNEWRNIHEFID